MYRDHFETFEHCGLTFVAYKVHDDSMRAPWKENEGHGDVRDARGESNFSSRPVKQPGERFLTWERGRGLAYDWQGTMKKARAEGWGLDDTATAELSARLGREPRGREVTAEAVRRDFERLRAWANDEWHYVGVIVELLDVEGNGTDEEESLWGIESDYPDYHAEVARELADQLADRLNLAGAKGRRRKKITRETAARSESIRVRA